MNCPRFGHGLQGLQRIQNNAPLAFHVARFTEHTTACKLDKHGPGGLDVSHSLGGIARRDSGNSGFLYQTLNQTHGLMTFRSDRHQEEDVDPCGFDLGNEFWNRFCDQSHSVVDIAEAVMRIGQFADDAFIFQFDQALDGKDDVDVLLCQAVIVMRMGNADFFLADGFGISRKEVSPWIDSVSNGGWLSLR